jgi:dTDP-glucose 4,6-dehydratase
MKILVTGGAGFIGSEFVRQAVERGYRVSVVDKLTYAGDLERLLEVQDKIVFYQADIINREFLEYIFKTEKPEAVIHWAAESHVDRSLLNASPFLDTNIKGTQVLLDLARRYPISKFINISTDEVYGDLGPKGHFTEESPLIPNSPYSVSKASADMLGRAYFRSHGIPVITVRPSNNYGPWQYPEKLIPLTILKAVCNEKIPIYGKGENVREWLYVEDCARAVLTILDKGKPGDIYNVGSGEEKKNLEVVSTILDILDKPHDLIEFVKDRPGHDFRYSMDFEKIKTKLNWKPEINFQHGIEQTVKWYLTHLKWLKEKLGFLRAYWNKIYIP